MEQVIAAISDRGRAQAGPRPQLDNLVTDNKIRNRHLLMFHENSPIEVHVSAYICARRNFTQGHLGRKREALWHDQKRNEAIAEITRAFLAGDLEALWQFGLFVGRQYTAASVPFLMPNWLAVVVEGLEHGTELQKLLPELALDRAYPAVTTSWQPMSIVTMTRLSQTNYFMPTVVIDAVGGRHALELPQDFDARGADCPAAVIELDDAFDDKAIKDTTRRLEQYAFRRWPVYPESRLSFNPLDIPTRSRTRQTVYQKRVAKWLKDAKPTTPATSTAVKKGGNGQAKPSGSVPES